MVSLGLAPARSDLPPLLHFYPSLVYVYRTRSRSTHPHHYGHPPSEQDDSRYSLTASRRNGERSLELKTRSRRVYDRSSFFSCLIVHKCFSFLFCCSRSDKSEIYLFIINSKPADNI